ncbi:MFS transporter [Streptomyces sp. NPDC006602]|uniref:MFS transporter n=1 Tax=Streptomyces sp. NPDC006602 TaxID=3364751 RepID=UPI0036C89195
MGGEAVRFVRIPRRSLPPLGGLVAAVAVSLTGSRVAAVALPWFVLVTTGSVTQTGVVAFCETAPYVASKALAGPWIDRLGPRRVSWVTDLASAASVVLIPLLHALNLLSYALLLVLVAVVGAVRGPGDLAKEVMVPQAAELSGVALERGTGWIGVMERLSGTLGPMAGGGLVLLFGPMAGLAVNGAAFLLGSALVALALPKGMGGPVPAAGRESGYLRSLGEAFTLLRSDPLLVTIIVMLTVTNFLDAAMWVLLPVWARDSGSGAGMFGLLLGVSSATAVGGSLVAATIAHRLSRRRVFFGGFLLGGAPKFLILAMDVPAWVVVAVFAVGGFGTGFLNPVLGAVLFERIPPELLGRVQGLGSSLAFAGTPLGGLLAGAGAAAVGLVPVLMTVGLAYLLATVASGMRPEWRRMDEQRVSSPNPSHRAEALDA